MASTYTVSLGIEKPGVGEQTGTWGGTMNTNFDQFDMAISGAAEVALVATGSSGSPNEVIVTDPADRAALSDGRNLYVEFTGTPGGTTYVQFTPDTIQKIGYLKNNTTDGSDLLIFQGTYDAGRDYQLDNGVTAIVRFDGGGAGAANATVISPLITTNAISLVNTGTLSWRNAADDDNITLTVDANDDFILTHEGTTVFSYDAGTGVYDFQTNTLAAAGIHQPATDSTLNVSGSSAATTGGNIMLYGSTHATLAKDIALRSDTTNKLQWDNSAAEWLMAGTLKVGEQAAANDDTAAYGQFWVKSTTPCEAWFTDDAGTDFQLSGNVSPLTTKGDVYTFSSVNARLGVGADGTVLTAASGQATGLEWATAPASSIVNDTSPQLGATLLSNNFNIYMETGTEIRFYETSGTHYASISSPEMAASYDLVLPTTDGAASEVLETDGSGNLSWASNAGGGAGDVLHTDFAADGLIVRSGSENYEQRTIAVGTAGGVNIGNGNGTAGNPTVELDYTISEDAPSGTPQIGHLWLRY